jgi:hypothetical protein
MVLFMAIGILSFGIATVASLKLKTAHFVPILVIIGPLPLYVGIVGLYPNAEVIWASLKIIEISGITPTTAELAAGGATALMPVMIGLLLSLQTYLLAVVVLCYRAFRHREAS